MDLAILVTRNSQYKWLRKVTPQPMPQRWKSSYGAYIAFVLARKGRGHLSVNRFLRATWVGGAAESQATLRNRRLRDAYDTASLRADDHATIGALLFAVLTPALLWKRANTANLVLGGAGIGTAVGLLTHYGRTLTGDPAPEIQIDISVPP
ncbi:hypothetical protein V8B97DRAFT_1732660 [Scleroderma yunnanense]